MADKHNKIKVTEKVFNAVKILAKGGATIAEIAEYMSISESTVSAIKKAETYEEYRNTVYTSSAWYRNKMAAIKAKENKKEKETDNKETEQPVKPVAETKQTIVVQASHYMLEEQKKTNELLTAISNKLAFIVDELTK